MAKRTFIASNHTEALAEITEACEDLTEAVRNLNLVGDLKALRGLQFEAMRLTARAAALALALRTPITIAERADALAR